MSMAMSYGLLRPAMSASGTRIRALHACAVSAAAAAAAPASSNTTSRYVRRTPVGASSASSRTASRPVSSSRASAVSASSSAAAPAARSAPSSVPPPSAPSSSDSDFDYGSPSPAAQPPSSIPTTPDASTYASFTPPSYASSSSGGDAPLPEVTGGIPGEVSAPAGADWSTSFQGLSERPFSKEAIEHLLKPVDPADVELKPDGLLYLPEIKYRRVLNLAFGPGGWGLAPRGETSVGPRNVSREWGLVCLGRLVAIARGEQEYFDPSGIPTATEACKSNALMRCCKDLGIASELWDPRFIREFKEKYCVEVMVEHVTQKKKRKLWRKKDGKFDYPYKEIPKSFGA